MILMDVLTLSVLFQVSKIAKDTKKCNKNIQETKVRLHWLREGINALQVKLKVKG